MVYFCPEGGGERGGETVRNMERERVPLRWTGYRRGEGWRGQKRVRWG